MIVVKDRSLFCDIFSVSHILYHNLSHTCMHARMPARTHACWFQYLTGIGNLMNSHGTRKMFLLHLRKFCVAYDEACYSIKKRIELIK